MLWTDLKREVAIKLGGNQALADERPFVYVDSATQQLHWIEVDVEYNRSYPISTAGKGMGNLRDSYQTPRGIHRIRQKIGGGEEVGSIFEAREPIGKVAGDYDNREKDEITSRILWLDGLEQGINHGGDCDTYTRYIYIHGTSDEKRIGQPVSAGCIRMKNHDVIELFDQVLVDDLVLIT